MRKQWHIWLNNCFNVFMGVLYMYKYIWVRICVCVCAFWPLCSVPEISIWSNWSYPWSHLLGMLWMVTGAHYLSYKMIQISSVKFRELSETRPLCKKGGRSPSKSLLPKRAERILSIEIMDVYDQQIWVDSDVLLLQDLLMCANYPPSKWH